MDLTSAEHPGITCEGRALATARTSSGSSHCWTASSFQYRSGGPPSPMQPRQGLLLIGEDLELERVHYLRHLRPSEGDRVLLLNSQEECEPGQDPALRE